MVLLLVEVLAVQNGMPLEAAIVVILAELEASRTLAVVELLVPTAPLWVVPTLVIPSPILPAADPPQLLLLPVNPPWSLHLI